MNDFLFINGTILTMSEAKVAAQAVLVRGDKIVFVGTEANAKPFLLASTQTIDLQGQCLMPGFHDSHVHLVQHGFERSQLDLSVCQSKEEGLALVAKKVNGLPESEWILGAGFLMSRWGVRELTKEDLDKVAPNHPVLLRSQDHHSAWVNSKALELAGVSAATPNPQDGEIVRNAKGEATGLLLEQALACVSSSVPTPSNDAIKDAVWTAAKHFASLGITTVHHMAAEPAAYWRGLAQESSKDDYPVRVWACLPQQNSENAAAIGVATGQGGKNFQVGGAKFFADGALGSLTAHMLEPYEGYETTGVEVEGREILRERFPVAIKAGLTPVVHAIGDAANQAVLDVLEETQALWKAQGMRPRIEHAQHLAPKDIKRFADLGVIASMQPIHFKFDAESTASLLGERIDTTHAWRSLLDSGASLPFGSDTPVASPDVVVGLETAVSRRSEQGKVYGEAECLSIEEALAAYTKHAAYAVKWEDHSGQLKAGFDADLVILSHDPRQSLEDLKIKATMKAGRWTFKA